MDFSCCTMYYQLSQLGAITQYVHWRSVDEHLFCIKKLKVFRGNSHSAINPTTNPHFHPFSHSAFQFPALISYHYCRQVISCVLHDRKCLSLVLIVQSQIIPITAPKKKNLEREKRKKKLHPLRILSVPASVPVPLQMTRLGQLRKLKNRRDRKELNWSDAISNSLVPVSLRTAKCHCIILFKTIELLIHTEQQYIIHNHPFLSLFTALPNIIASPRRKDSLYVGVHVAQAIQ